MECREWGENAEALFNAQSPKLEPSRILKREGPVSRCIFSKMVTHIRKVFQH